MFFQNKENILKWGKFIIDETTVTIHIIMIIIIIKLFIIINYYNYINTIIFLRLPLILLIN